MKLKLLLLIFTVVTACARDLENTIWVDASCRISSAADGSKARPYKTITAAMRAIKPGSTMAIRAGTYRESINTAGGVKGRPVTITNMPGERVILNGMSKVSGWQPVGSGIYKTTIAWKPDKLFIGFTEQPLARIPKEGWWSVASKGPDTFLSDKLKSVPGNLDGVTSYIWTQHGNIFFTLNINSIDRQAGTAVFKVPNKWFKLTTGDKVFLKNHPALISQAGEWAVVKSNSNYVLYYKPASAADLNKVEASRSRRNIINIYDKTDVIIRGLEVCGSMNSGIYAMKSNRVTIENCIVHDNSRDGIGVRAGKDCLVRNNLVIKNYTGISVLYSSGVTVEKNEIGFNYMDGLVVSWKSRDITVKNNYSHDHLLWGHPDNMQIYRDVKNIKILDNLFSTGGQTLMVEQADNILYQGNMSVGSIANQVIFGHNNTTNVKVSNNTFAFPGYSPLAVTGRNYELAANVMMLGHRGMFFSYKPANKFSSRNNLFWGAEKRDGGIAGNGFHKTFQTFKQANPEAEKKSFYANPLFVNAPVYLHVLKSGKIPECTRKKLYLRDGTGDFTVGDNVEINFDGIKRKVTKMTSEYLIIDPPLQKAPIKPWMIANWKNNHNFNLDLRLQPSSPGAKMFQSKPVGSQINIQAYKAGDFNGDGKRDVPELPADVKLPMY